MGVESGLRLPAWELGSLVCYDPSFRVRVGASVGVRDRTRLGGYDVIPAGTVCVCVERLTNAYSYSLALTSLHSVH